MSYTGKNNLRIIVADDHPFYLHGIKQVVSKLPYVDEVLKAENGQEVINLVKENKGNFDIIFMDISMPVMDGIAATTKITTIYPDIKIIALTLFDDFKTATSMFDAGATGYLLKDVNRDELEIAIETVLKGEFYYSKKIADVLLKKMNERNTKQKNGTPLNNAITPRELEVLFHICEGLTAEEIADKLNVSFHTIVTHRISLFEKTDTKNIVGLVKFAISKGYYKMPDV